MKNVEEYFKLAIEEMKKTVIESRDDGKIDPAVGAVIVLPNGAVYSAHRGELRNGNHAEFTLLERKLINVDCTGATMFVTLEPCAVGSRSFPKHACCEWIVGARIKTVYVGIEDPDPNVAQNGMRYLQENGVEIQSFPQAYQKQIKKFNKEFLEQAKLRTKKEKKPVSQHILKEFVSSDKGLDLLSDEALSEYAKHLGLNYSTQRDELIDHLLDMELIKKDDTGKYLVTKDAYIMFGKNPALKMPQVCIIYSFNYNGNQTVETYEGPMVCAVDDAIARIRQVLPLVTKIDVYRRNDLLVPERIIREAIVNSIAHRDYSIEGAKIRIEIYDDRMIIKSPGLPQPPVTFEAMQRFEAPSFSRNPKLTYIFREMDLMEENRLGMNVFSDMPHKYSLRTPEYEYVAPNIELTFWFKPIENVLESLSSDEKRAYEACRGMKQITRNELMQVMQISDRSASRLLKKLVDVKLLIQTGTGKGTKYTLAS